MPAALVTIALMLSACGGDEGSPKTAPPPPGNGVEKLSGQEIVDRAEAAVEKATSVHFAGSAVSDGQKLEMDVHASESGTGKGRLNLGVFAFDVVRDGATVYFKGDEKFYSAILGGKNPKAVSQLEGKYLKAAATDAQWKELAGFTDSDEFLKSLFEDDGKPQTYTVGPQKTVNGTRTVAVVKAGKEGGTMYVALDGEPFPVRIEPAAGSGDSGALDFSEWNKPVTVTPPAADQVLDPTTLQ